MFRIITLDQTNPTELLKVWNNTWNANTAINFTWNHLRNYLYINSIFLSSSLGLTYNGILIGFSLLGIDKRKNGWLGNIAIEPGSRGNGLLKLILDKHLELAQHSKLNRLNLEVAINNYAYKTYKRYGFRDEQQLYNFDIPAVMLYKHIFPVTEKLTFNKVTGKQYFSARCRTRNSFPWKKQEECIIKYDNLIFCLADDLRAGYVLSLNTPYHILDLWTFSEEGAKELIACLISRVNKVFLKNQIYDCTVSYLARNDFRPQLLNMEMSLNLN